MSTGQGWIGYAGEIENFLRAVRADRDDDGKFLIYGESPVSFMGAEKEIVVPADAEYSVMGKRMNLAHGLSGTSYGLGVVVISS
jgi:hypothetical protein